MAKEAWETDPDAAFAEARRRIAVAAESDDPKVRESLDFGDLKRLERLPEELFEFVDLRELSFRLFGPGGFRGSNVHFTAFDQLQRLPQLTSLDLSGLYGLADLSFVSRLSRLTSLTVGGPRIRHESLDLAPLYGLTELVTLNLNGNPITNASPLSGLPALTMLDLSRTRIKDAAPLADLKLLTDLNLSGTQVTDATPLLDLTRLTRLDLGGTPISDLTPLSGLAILKWLNLGGTSVIDLTPLSGLTSLAWVNLGETPLFDATPLSGLPNLTWLNFEESKLSDVMFLLSLPGFAAERGEFLGFASTPAADPEKDRRLYMLSRLDGKRCAVETVQYLKGTHPDFRDPPGGALARPLAQRLAEASPLGLAERDGRIEAENPGDPERLAPRERAVRVQALRAHVQQLRDEAEAKQLPADLRARLATRSRWRLTNRRSFFSTGRWRFCAAGRPTPM